jgi:hypothetical protein
MQVHLDNLFASLHSSMSLCVIGFIPGVHYERSDMNVECPMTNFELRIYIHL